MVPPRPSSNSGVGARGRLAVDKATQATRAGLGPVQICSLETAEQVVQIVRDLTGRLAHLPRNLPRAHRMIQRQINQVFAEHNPEGSNNPSLARVTADSLQPACDPRGLVIKSRVLIEPAQFLIALHHLETHAPLELAKANRAK